MTSRYQKEQCTDLYISKMSPKTNTSSETYQYQQQQFEQQVTIVFNTNAETILSQFESLTQRLNYQLLQMENSYATAIKKRKNSLLNLFSCVSFCSLTSISGVKISLKQSKYDSETIICKIKPMIGNEDKQFSIFIKQFLAVTKIYQENNAFVYNEKPTDSETKPSNPFQNQNHAYYVVSKILSNTGNQISNYLNQKLIKIKEVYQRNWQGAEKTLKALLRQLTLIIKQIITKLHHRFKSNPQQYSMIMPFCRIAVQNFVFGKVEKYTNALYLQKNLEIQSKFQKRKAQILQKLNLEQLLQGVCAGDKLKKYLRQGNYSIADLKKSSNLELACFQFKQMSSFVNPRQKIKICENAYASLKSYIYEKSHRKYQLTCMEDIIPMTILLLLFSEERSNLRSELDLMLAYAQFDVNQLELEKRLVLNLSQSYNYILKYWQL